MGIGASGPISGGMGSLQGIIIPTMLQIADDVTEQFSGITCLYDPNWVNRADFVSLPLAFFYVKGISETMKSEISKKRVILYEPQTVKDAATLANGLRPSVLEAVADNIVSNMKEYQLEIVLPFQLTSGLAIRQMNDLGSLVEGFSEILDATNYTGSVPGVPGGLASIVNGTSGALTEALSIANKYVSLAAKLPGSSGAAYINKNSIEAMWRGKRVLTMKMWTGWDYKYVVITGFDVKKDPKEDDVFRAVLTLTELQVLTVNTANDMNSLNTIDRDWAATAVSLAGQAAIAPLAKLTGVDAASKLYG
jgi:hypothetical protein